MLCAHTAPGQSLAAAQPGRTVRLTAILFETVRAHCVRLGLEEGDVVTIHASTPDAVVLLAGGRTLRLDRAFARFIQVAPHGRGAPHARTRHASTPNRRAHLTA